MGRAGKPLWMAGAHADVTELQQARQDAAETGSACRPWSMRPMRWR
jgi:hypothetical protein